MEAAHRMLLLQVLFIPSQVIEGNLWPNDMNGPYINGSMSLRPAMQILNDTIQLKDDRNSNILVGPLSISILMAMYSGMTSHEALRSLVFQELTNCRNYSTAMSHYANLSRRYSDVDSHSISVDSRLYIDENLKVTDRFYQMCDAFTIEHEKLRFEDQDQVVQHINDWMYKVSRGRIDKTADDLTPLTDTSPMAFVNVVSMHGEWLFKFTGLGSPGIFHVSGNTTVYKKMMRVVAPLPFARLTNKEGDSEVEVVEIPYEVPDFRLAVLLPGNETTVEDLVTRFTEDPDSLYRLFRSVKLTGSMVEVVMPYFSVRGKTYFNQVLSKLNVIYRMPNKRIAMNANVTMPLSLQEVYVKFDEFGRLTPPLPPADKLSWDPIPMHLNKPFIFCILHHEIILLIGVYHGHD